MAGRSTQQFFEVFSTAAVKSDSASNALSLSDSVFRSDATGNSILLGQSVGVNLVSGQTASSTLVLADEATKAGTTNKSRESVLSLSDTATYKRVLPTQTASSTITFTDEAFGHRAASSIIALTHDLVYELYQVTGEGENTLTFSDLATAQATLNLSVSSKINFVSVTSRQFIDVEEVTDTLAFRDSAFASFVKDYVILEAPYEFLTAGVTLPRPLFQDSENLVDDLDIDFAEDGTLYTYIREITDRRLSYTFRLTREKSLELQGFLDTYNSDWMRLCNWKGEVWRVHLFTNPVEYVQIAKGANCGPTVDVSLTFEGTKIYG